MKKVCLTPHKLGSLKITSGGGGVVIYLHFVMFSIIKVVTCSLDLNLIIVTILKISCGIRRRFAVYIYN